MKFTLISFEVLNLYDLYVIDQNSCILNVMNYDKNTSIKYNNQNEDRNSYHWR